MARLKRRRILEEWTSFREEVLGADFPPEAIHYVRCAFFAGATAFYRVLGKAAAESILNGEDESESEFNLAQDLKAELQAFCDEAIAAGRSAQ